MGSQPTGGRWGVGRRGLGNLDPEKGTRGLEDSAHPLCTWLVLPWLWPEGSPFSSLLAPSLLASRWAHRPPLFCVVFPPENSFIETFIKFYHKNLHT